LPGWRILTINDADFTQAIAEGFHFR